MIMLQLIAIECYRIGEYWTAAKAFDMLEKFSIDPNPEYWEGKVNIINNNWFKFNTINGNEFSFLILIKRGSCVGTFYSIITGRQIAAPPNGFIDICTLLRESTNPQVEAIIRTIRNFSNDMGWTFEKMMIFK